MNPNSYIALDIETTGLLPREDKILEIAAIRVEEGQIQDRFVTLINPEREITGEITRLTGITDSMVKEAPKIGEVIGSLIDFAEAFQSGPQCYF